jgi:sulfate transport system substrate-binding protein
MPVPLPLTGLQARAVIDGLPAELVALALPLDVDRIAAAGLIAKSEYHA